MSALASAGSYMVEWTVMPTSRFLIRWSVAAAAGTALLSLGALPAAAAPASDAQGFVDSTARCASPSTAVAYGRTDSSRIALCKSPDGKYQYRGVRVRDGAKLITAATATGDGEYVASNNVATYTVTSEALTVTIGDDVVREETMLEFHGQAAPSAPASPGPGPAPAKPTPTTPLPPPLPAEAGHRGT
ncbi:hypothetical protein [Mycobacterium sp. IS-1742]|uniref:hypothetical protein n=1 Tax=Mycobacterium sp. IS-1742 TaxID=1772285 RepID=UPI000A7AD8CF|nr:hypothetical protein [Mycobacterium sp. IS-1742]